MLRMGGGLSIWTFCGSEIRWLFSRVGVVDSANDFVGVKFLWTHRAVALAVGRLRKSLLQDTSN